MKDLDLIVLFPTPVFFKNIEIKLNKNQIELIDEIENKESYNNPGNKTSKNEYILDLEIFKNIKEILNSYVENYFYSILKINNIVKPYITQSWLNFTEEQQFHHSHCHSNSLISGVYYLNASENYDNITFHKGVYEQLQLPKNEYNIFNSTSWTLNVKTGDLILFPSQVSHEVNSKNGKNKRVSLAFNVFIKGKLGEENKANTLVL